MHCSDAFTIWVGRLPASRTYRDRWLLCGAALRRERRRYRVAGAEKARSSALGPSPPPSCSGGFADSAEHVPGGQDDLLIGVGKNDFMSHIKVKAAVVG